MEPLTLCNFSYAISPCGRCQRRFNFAYLGVQKRPLSAVYSIVFIDAIVFNVHDNGVIKKQDADIILGITC